MEGIVTEHVASCNNCQGDIIADSRFCPHCGSLQIAAKEESLETRWASLKTIALFFLIELAICAIFTFVKSLETFNGMLVCDALLAITTVAFFVYNWKEDRLLLRWPNFSATKLLLYTSAALLGSVFVHYTVTWLNLKLFSKELSYYLFFLQTHHAKVFLILFTAVFPAIFEEAAYRGFVLQKLIKVIDPWQAAFVTSFLFAILHLSILSLFWLIPFAMLLAFVRQKEQTIWYGVCIHFVFNLTVCVFELLKYR